MACSREVLARHPLTLKAGAYRSRNSDDRCELTQQQARSSSRRHSTMPRRLSLRRSSAGTVRSRRLHSVADSRAGQSTTALSALGAIAPSHVMAAFGRGESIDSRANATRSKPHRPPRADIDFTPELSMARPGARDALRTKDSPSSCSGAPPCPATTARRGNCSDSHPVLSEPAFS